LKQCDCCKGNFGPESFAPTKSKFYSDHVIPLCDDCIANLLEDAHWDWGEVNKLCQYADVPFAPKEWEKIKTQAGRNVFHKYCEIFME